MNFEDAQLLDLIQKLLKKIPEERI